MSSAWFATRPRPPTWPDHAVLVGSGAVRVATAPSSAQPDTPTPSAPPISSWAAGRSRVPPGVGAVTIVSVPAGLHRSPSAATARPRALTGESGRRPGARSPLRARLRPEGGQADETARRDVTPRAEICGVTLLAMGAASGP